VRLVRLLHRLSLKLVGIGLIILSNCELLLGLARFLGCFKRLMKFSSLRPVVNEDNCWLYFLAISIPCIFSALMEATKSPQRRSVNMHYRYFDNKNRL